MSLISGSNSRTVFTLGLSICKAAIVAKFLCTERGKCGEESEGGCEICLACALVVKQRGKLWCCTARIVARCAVFNGRDISGRDGDHDMLIRSTLEKDHTSLVSVEDSSVPSQSSFLQTLGGGRLAQGTLAEMPLLDHVEGVRIFVL